MSKDKSSISKAESYGEIGEYWATHDITELGDTAKPVDFDVDIQSVKNQNGDGASKGQ
ncbi:MAG: hypothetical protein GY765_02980, partial [bacterium]|nr:hypothetical protein [bacterium]